MPALRCPLVQRDEGVDVDPRVSGGSDDPHRDRVRPGRRPVARVDQALQLRRGGLEADRRGEDAVDVDPRLTAGRALWCNPGDAPTGEAEPKRGAGPGGVAGMAAVKAARRP